MSKFASPDHPESTTFGEQKVSVSLLIDAPADHIFDILASPDGHAKMDGSGTVRAARSDQRLEMGSKFSMRMKLGVPYVIGNTVVEFDENRLIAWQHIGKHRWRFELEPQGDQTLVTETFDWSTSFLPAAIEAAGYPKRHPVGMGKTLERLAELVAG